MNTKKLGRIFNILLILSLFIPLATYAWDTGQSASADCEDGQIIVSWSFENKEPEGDENIMLVEVTSDFGSSGPHEVAPGDTIDGEFETGVASIGGGKVFFHLEWKNRSGTDTRKASYGGASCPVPPTNTPTSVPTATPTATATDTPEPTCTVSGFAAHTRVNIVSDRKAAVQAWAEWNNGPDSIRIRWEFGGRTDEYRRGDNPIPPFPGWELDRKDHDYSVVVTFIVEENGEVCHRETVEVEIPARPVIPTDVPEERRIGSFVVPECGARVKVVNDPPSIHEGTAVEFRSSEGTVRLEDVESEPYKVSTADLPLSWVGLTVEVWVIPGPDGKDSIKWDDIRMECPPTATPTDTPEPTATPTATNTPVPPTDVPPTTTPTTAPPSPEKEKEEAVKPVQCYEPEFEVEARKDPETGYTRLWRIWTEDGEQTDELDLFRLFTVFNTVVDIQDGSIEPNSRCEVVISILFEGEDQHDLFVFGSTGEYYRQLTDSDEDEVSPEWLNSGDIIFSEGRVLYLTDSLGRNIQPFEVGDGGPYTADAPAVSPGSDQFMVMSNFRGQVTLMDLATGEYLITDYEGDLPAWAPDGTAISWVEDGNVVVVLGLETGEVADAIAGGRIVWSPQYGMEGYGHLELNAQRWWLTPEESVIMTADAPEASLSAQAEEAYWSGLVTHQPLDWEIDPQLGQQVNMTAANEWLTSELTASAEAEDGGSSAEPVCPGYNGDSLVDCLKEAGMDSSFEARALLAVGFGVVDSIDEYTGSGGENGQNMQLLELLLLPARG